MDYNRLEQIRTTLNEKRAKIKNTVFRVYLIIFLIVLSFIVISLGTAKSTIILEAIFGLIPFALYLAFFHFIGYIIAVSVVTKDDQIEYKNAYKSYFVTETFKKVFTDISYSHKAAMPRNLIADTRMMNMGDRYSSNDYVIAKYKGISFKQADVHIQEEHSDDDGTTYVTIFRGRWIIFDLNKKFEKRLLVEGRHFGCARIAKQDNFKKMELESGEFNRNFDVRAQDGFEAYYLLDPAVMERIQKLSDLHNGRIMVCFADGKMHIGINNNIDSFEPPSPIAPIDEKKEFDKVINDIKVITNIVDEIKLIR